MDFITINMDRYPRRKHFEYFCSLPYPYVGVTADVDVTEFIQFCKRHHYSFYLAFLHLAALAANDVREFRQRIHNGGIVEYTECPTSHTELLDNGTYCYCALYHHMPWEEYIVYAEKTRKQCRENEFFEESDDAEQMYFVSTLPGLHYTSLVQPVAGGEESNPRITWGKYQKDHNGREQLPVTVLAHHGLVDGIHITQFYQNLARYIRETVE